MKRKYKVKNKFKFSIFLTVLLVLMGFSFSSALDADPTVGIEPIYKTIQVQSGDTLWMIAKSFGDDKTDPRKTIYDICEINQLTSKDIYPGQLLKVQVHSKTN